MMDRILFQKRNTKPVLWSFKAMMMPILYTISDDVTHNAPADAVIKNNSALNVNVTVDDVKTVSLDVYVNGLYFNSFEVLNNKVIIEINEDRLTALPGKKNVISVIGRNSDGETTYKNFCTIIQNDQIG